MAVVMDDVVCKFCKKSFPVLMLSTGPTIPLHTESDDSRYRCEGGGEKIKTAALNPEVASPVEVVGVTDRSVRLDPNLSNSNLTSFYEKNDGEELAVD